MIIAWLAEWLLHCTWMALAIALVVAVATRLWQRPAARHLITVAGLALVIAGMVAGLFWSWPAQAAPTPVSVEGSATPTTTARLPLDQAPHPLTVGTPATEASIPAEPIDWQLWAVLAWSLGLTVMILRQMTASWRAWRLRSSSMTVPSFLQDLVATWAGHLAVAVPQVRVTSRLSVPAVIGWWRPALVIPATLLAMPRAELEALIAHELAHLRRHDWLTEVPLCIVECALFYHPAIWWLGRELRRSREECCDATAVRGGIAPERLAQALLALAERHLGRSTPALAATGGVLEQRIRRLLDLPADTARRGRSMAALLLALVIAVSGSAIDLLAQEADSGPEPVEPLAETAETATEDEPDRTFGLSLQERIDAYADNRNLIFRIQLVEADLDWWHEMGVREGEPRMGDRSAMQAWLSDEKASILHSQRLVTSPLQSAQIGTLRQRKLIAGYRLAADSAADVKPDPVFRIVDLGLSSGLTGQGAGDHIRIREVRVQRLRLLNPASSARLIPWHDQEGRRVLLNVHQPEFLAEDLQVPAAGLELAADRLWAGLLSQRILTSTDRSSDLPATPTTRLGCIITAEFLPANPHWRMKLARGTPDHPRWWSQPAVSCSLENATLEEALDAFRAQLPVPIRFDPTEAALSAGINLTLQHATVHEAMERLLSQTLLEAEIHSDHLVLGPLGISNFPANDLITKAEAFIQEQQRLSDTFPLQRLEEEDTGSAAYLRVQALPRDEKMAKHVHQDLRPEFETATHSIEDRQPPGLVQAPAAVQRRIGDWLKERYERADEPAAQQEPVTRLYDTSDLTDPPAHAHHLHLDAQRAWTHQRTVLDDTGNPARMEQAMTLLRQSIAPDRWDDAGWAFEQRDQHLLIAATPAVHARVEQALDLYREHLIPQRVALTIRHVPHTPDLDWTWPEPEPYSLGPNRDPKLPPVQVMEAPDAEHMVSTLVAGTDESVQAHRLELWHAERLDLTTADHRPTRLRIGTSISGDGRYIGLDIAPFATSPDQHPTTMTFLPDGGAVAIRCANDDLLLIEAAVNERISE